MSDSMDQGQEDNQSLQIDLYLNKRDNIGNMVSLLIFK